MIGRIAFIGALAVLSLQAQIGANKASIGGLVGDTAGAPIPHAKVVAVNASTGLERDGETNESGLYRFDGLDAGTYELRVGSSGTSVSVRDVNANVGSQIRLNVTIAVSATPATYDVSASALPLTESSSTAMFTESLIDNLPINGRRFQDFATLAPTVQALPETRGQLSISGQRGINSNVMVDGTDYNEPFLGGIRGGDRSTLAFTIPQSAIQEFQVVSQGFSTEYGRSTGGILNVLTRSGSNEIHGQAFYQMRDQALGATDPLGFKSLERQHQFGGNVGGPVRKDKLFFFAASEQQLARYPRQIRFSALDSIASQVTPDISPAYNYFRSLERDFSQSNDASAVFGRADYQLRGGSHLSGSYNFSRNAALNAVSAGASLQPQVNQALETNGRDSEFTKTVTGQWTGVFKGSLIDDLRVHFSREEADRRPNGIGPYVESGIIGSFGSGPSLPRYLNDYRFQIADGISLVKGRHSLAAGVDFSRIGVHQKAGADQFGSFIISGSDVRRALQVLSGGPAQNRFDDPSVIFRRQVGSLSSNIVAHQLAFHAQDTWRATPTLTLTYGVRWEGQFNPQPVTDNKFLVSNVRDFSFPLGRVDPTVIRSPLDQWAPRLSFAWDVNGRQRTVIRGHVGIYYGQTPLFYLAAPLDNVSTAPSDLSLQIAPQGANTIYRMFSAGGFNLNSYSLGHFPIFSIPDIWVNVAGKPDPFAQANVITTSGENFKNPRSLQMSLSWEQRLTKNLSIDLQFRNLNTVHLERNTAINMPRPFVRPGDLSLRPIFGLRSGVPRPNPNLGWIIMRDSSARAAYAGQTFAINYRARNIQFMGNYTLGFNKSDDDNERELVGLTYQNPFDFSREYNWSSLDSRHQATASALWKGLAGIEIAATFRYRSALPLDASTGDDTSELLSGNFGNRPLQSPGVFMLRNSFRNRDFKDVDLRVTKNFVVSERAKLQAYADLFNVFNFGNVAFLSASTMPNNPAFIYGLGVLPNGQPAPVDPRFMRIRNSSGNYDPAVSAQQGLPLQVQVGLRLLF